MKFTKLAIPDIVLVEPNAFADDRGHFFESYNKAIFDEGIGRSVDFIQDNQSLSKRGVLRGLHYQLNFPQCKLVRVLQGEIQDVAVDLRTSSPYFGQWVGEILSADNRRQLWIPEGFAHGFLVLSESAEVLYKVNSPYRRDDEECLLWNDRNLGINWELTEDVKLSRKDQLGARLSACQRYN